MPQLRRDSTALSPDTTAIKRALGDLAQRSGDLASSPWVANSCLVARHLEANPDALGAAAVTAVFDQVLAALEK